MLGYKFTYCPCCAKETFFYLHATASFNVWICRNFNFHREGNVTLNARRTLAETQSHSAYR